MINLGISLSSKQQHNKRFLKELSRDYIPDKIINRKKEGLMTPFDDWMKSDLSEEIKKVLLTDKGFISRDIFNNDGFIQFVENYFLGVTINWCEIQSLFILELWLKIHLDLRLTAKELKNIGIKEFVNSYY